MQVIANHAYSDRPRPKVDCGVGLTKQSFVKECNINEIIRKSIAGKAVALNQQNPIYGDFSNVVDYQTSLEVVKRAEAQFMGLSADVRKRFNHDPAAFLEFATNPDNGEEMVKLGLAKVREVASAPSTHSPDAPAPASGSNPPAVGAGASQ